MTEIVRVPFHGTELLTVETDGRPHIVLRPAIEAIGLDYATQFTKLKSRSWAVVGQSPTTGSDGKTYQMVTVDVRTFLMLLATVDERRVAEHVRPLLVAYQREVADVIESYWTTGAAVRPAPAEPERSPVVEVPFDDYERLLVGGQQLLARMRAQQREIETQRAELEETNAYVESIEPDAEAFRTIVTDTVGDYNARDAASFLRRSDPRITIGQNTLIWKLRDWKVLDGHDRPYSAHGKHFHLKPQFRKDRETGEQIPVKPQVRITFEGLSYIRRRLLAELARATAEAQQHDLFSSDGGGNVRSLPARRGSGGAA